MDVRRWSAVVVGALTLALAGGTTSSGAAAEVEPPVAVVSVPVVSTSRSATLDLPVRWSAPGASGPVTFTVQYRTVGDNGMDVRTYSTPVVWASGTTAMSKTYVGKPARVVQFRARATDAQGRTGAYSAWQTTTFPIDDRFMVNKDLWCYPEYARDAYLGTYQDCGYSSARLSRSSVPGDHIRVIGATSPGSGKVEVRVDGVLKATVDLYSAATRHRQILWSGAVPYARHSVELRPVRVDSTRRAVLVDGVAFSR